MSNRNPRVYEKYKLEWVDRDKRILKEETEDHETIFYHVDTLGSLPRIRHLCETFLAVADELEQRAAQLRSYVKTLKPYVGPDFPPPVSEFKPKRRKVNR